MAKIYRPPTTDSEDDGDFEGFSFSSPSVNNHKERYKNQVIQNPVTALLNKLSETILDRDFVGYINVFTSSELSNKVDVNEPGANGSWSLFYQACFQGFAELVQYMIKKQGAKVNQQNCSETPLMIVCKSDSNSQEVLKVVKMLCLESCIINASNSVGMTAFMLACFHGHTDVAELLLKMDVSLEATDNNDYNALHFAVERNRTDIVKLLLNVQGGFLKNGKNKNGYTPQQLANINENQEIIDLFPIVEKKYEVPYSYTSYNNFINLAPEIFEGTDIPAYFPDVVTMLNGMNGGLLINFFGQAEVTLEEFLLMDDLKLQEIGIIFPFQRKKVLQGLMQFHSQKWKKSSLQMFKYEDQMDYLEFFYVFANLLKHLKILNCSCKYMINLKKELTTDGQLENTQNLVECLQKFNDKLQEVRNYLIEVKELNPKKDHLLLTERVEEEIKPSNNFIQKLTIIGVALTPVLGFCFYKLMKR